MTDNAEIVSVYNSVYDFRQDFRRPIKTEGVTLDALLRVLDTYPIRVQGQDLDLMRVDEKDSYSIFTYGYLDIEMLDDEAWSVRVDCIITECTIVHIFTIGDRAIIEGDLPLIIHRLRHSR